jgi:DNA-binding winged helix-turn-helix (wHTH) protein
VWAYRFGECVFDATAFRVTRSGVPVHLEPKALDVLRYLIEQPGLLVSKDEVIHAVWKDTSVGDNALTRLIAQLRRGLGDPVHQPRYIETVPTRGYRSSRSRFPSTTGPLVALVRRQQKLHDGVVRRDVPSSLW